MSETLWTCENGVWILKNAAVEVVIDEATFARHYEAYCLQHGIDTRSYEELIGYVTRVEQQHYEVQVLLCNPEYWLRIADPHICITEKKKEEQGEEKI